MGSLITEEGVARITVDNGGTNSKKIGGIIMKKLIICAVLILLPTISMADDRQRKPGTGPNPFSDCGIGAALFNNQSVQIAPLAVTSNVIWDLGSTGSTSATASPETCTGPQIKTAQLILETLPGLEKDIALGRGKHLSALHETIGCDITRQGEINSSLRISYAEVVSDKGYEKKSAVQRASDMYDSMKMVTSSIKDSCKVAL